MATISPNLGPSHVAGGTWTITPDPTAINASSGDIDSDILDAGAGSGTTYTVTYTAPNGCAHVDPFLYCKEDDASFTYPTGLCDGETSIVPDSITTSGGVFSISGKADETLTLTGQPLDTETVTIDAKAYTFQTVLTDVDGNVLIGATASDSLDNLIAAVTLGAGAGSLYATSMTLHPTATAAAGDGDTMIATAKTSGTGGNSIATTETLTNGSWGAATMSGGGTGAINPVTGLIDPSALGVGTFEVSYSVTNAEPCDDCTGTHTEDVVIADGATSEFTVDDQCIA